MEISEFRDLLTNDGFAATFQTMGQYRTELLRALDKLRAQADARPVMWVALTDEDRKAAFESLPDMLEGFLKKWGWLNFAKEIERRCKEKNADFVREAITHPEASAPGLSDAERAAVAGAIESITTSGAHIDLNIVNVLQGLLTRASAATAAEPSNARNAVGACLHGVDVRKSCSACAAQQQAKPSIPNGWRERLQEMRDASYTYSQYPELAQAVFDSVVDALDELEAAQQQAEPNHTALTLPYESALSELIGKIDPDLDTGDILADAKTASIQLDSLQAEPCPECNGSKTVTFAGDACPVCAQQAEHVGQACGDSAEHVGIQQAEPGADERAAFEASGLYDGLMVNARFGFSEGYRAAQSGQRAGVAVARVYKCDIHGAEVSCIEWLDYVGAQSIPADTLLYIAAPTQQQEGGNV